MKNRAATEAALVAAAEKILAEQGFSALNVSAVADAAGVDRKLVYRYFGGVEGIVECLGAKTARWLANPEGEAPSTSRGAFDAYAADLRRDEALQQILAWELVERSELLTSLDRTRSIAMGKRFAWLATAPDRKAGDRPAVNAVALAALHYLTLRARTLGGFSGLTLDERGWRRVFAVLHKLIDEDGPETSPETSPETPPETPA